MGRNGGVRLVLNPHRHRRYERGEHRQKHVGLRPRLRSFDLHAVSSSANVRPIFPKNAGRRSWTERFPISPAHPIVRSSQNGSMSLTRMAPSHSSDHEPWRQLSRISLRRAYGEAP